MESFVIDDKEVVYYSSVKELPIVVAKEFGAYLLQDVGIGNTIQDIDDHLEKAIAFLQADNKDAAVEEMKNLRLGLFSQLSGLDYTALSFLCLVKSVDGMEVTDRSVEGLQKLMEKLPGLTGGRIRELLDQVKKNLIRNDTFTFQNSSMTTGHSSNTESDLNY